MHVSLCTDKGRKTDESHCPNFYCYCSKKGILFDRSLARGLNTPSLEHYEPRSEPFSQRNEVWHQMAVHLSAFLDPRWPFETLATTLLMTKRRRGTKRQHQKWWSKYEREHSATWYLFSPIFQPRGLFSLDCFYPLPLLSLTAFPSGYDKGLGTCMQKSFSGFKKKGIERKSNSEQFLSSFSVAWKKWTKSLPPYKISGGWPMRSRHLAL